MILRTAWFLCVPYTEICINATSGWDCLLSSDHSLTNVSTTGDNPSTYLPRRWRFRISLIWVLPSCSIAGEVPRQCHYHGKAIFWMFELDYYHTEVQITFIRYVYWLRDIHEKVIYRWIPYTNGFKSMKCHKKLFPHMKKSFFQSQAANIILFSTTVTGSPDSDLGSQWIKTICVNLLWSNPCLPYTHIVRMLLNLV